MCWIEVYVTPPDMVAHDAGKQFMSKVFQANADIRHISTKAVSVESLNSMTFVERYHHPLRRAHKIIQDESPNNPADVCLQMAVKSINNSVGPDGRISILLVYRCLPRLGLPTDHPSPSTIQRAIALRKATAAMSELFSKSQISSALNTRNGPVTTDIRSAPLGCKVLVYRPEIDK